MACETATVRHGSKAVGLAVTATAAQAWAGKVAGQWKQSVVLGTLNYGRPAVGQRANGHD